MTRLTASALSRAEHCIGSAVLDGIPESSEWAATGTAIDAFVQQARHDRDAALRVVPDALRAYCEALDLRQIPEGAEFQVAFAYNVLTGAVKRIPSRTEGYPEDWPAEWIFGSTDIVGMRPGLGVVWDLKWGTYTIGRDPADDLQLGFYAVCVWKLARVDAVEVAFLRAGWDGRLVPDKAVLDEWALAALEERIKAVWRKQQSVAVDWEFHRPDGSVLSGRGMPPLSVGEHCTYCPARRACPAMVAPVAMVLAGDIPALASREPLTPETVRERIEALSLADMGRAYAVAEAAADRAALILSIIREHARNEPVPLADGKELREVMWGTQQKSDNAKAVLAAATESLKEAGEIKTVKVPQVRAMKARRA